MAEALQVIFDATCEHLAKQKHRAVRARPRGSQSVPLVCLYLAPNGDKCAYGCHIPEDEYQTEFEAKSADDLDRDLGYVAPAFRGEDGEFLSDSYSELAARLQTAHDTAANLPDILFSMNKVAERMKLDNAKVKLIQEWNG